MTGYEPLTDPFTFSWGIAVKLSIRQASTCGGILAQGPTPSAPKEWKSDEHVKSQNLHCATDQTNYRELYIQSAVSVL